MRAWRVRCPKRADGCDWTIEALTKEAARAARRAHHHEAHQPQPSIPTYPYRGKPNKTHLHLLAMAARGELLASESHVYFAGRGDSINLNDPASTLGPPLVEWATQPLQRRAEKWIPGLIEAGLLRDPKSEHLGKRFQYFPYRITPEGRRVLAQYEKKAS